jgi:hypothetical protein
VFAGGDFTMTGGQPVNRIAKWDGNDWLPLGSGLAGSAASVRSMALDSIDRVIVGGTFTEGGGSSSLYFGIWTGDLPTSVPTNTPAPPSVALEQNYPNPFNPSTTISFTLPSRTRVNLSIYDVRGRLVVKLVENTLPQGAKDVRWNGRHGSGNPVSSGVYFYRLSTSGQIMTRKMVLLR